MLKGRLGLETARIPHKDRYGLVWLSRGKLGVEDGCLVFETAGDGTIPAGRYGLPHQSVSIVLLGPGGSVTHDALRLLARHNLALMAVGEDGVRLYTAPPLQTDTSALARAQMRLWADAKEGRLTVARRMFALRFGETLPHRDLDVLRGIEGARMKETYRICAQRAGIRWDGRRYDRNNPGLDDIPNQALNHAAAAVEAAASIAVAATATIPQLGFIHEDSGLSFVLDVADLMRAAVTIPCAFKATAIHQKRPQDSLERLTRRLVGETLRREQVIHRMIEHIQSVLREED
jgi:CRISPR-associated protein Cas1